jgi:hypothetical protein
LSRRHMSASQQRQRHDDHGQHECSPCNLLLWARVLRRLDDAACGEADRSCIRYHTENQSGVHAAAMASSLGYTPHACRLYRERITRIIVVEIAPSYVARHTLKRWAMMCAYGSARIICR